MALEWELGDEGSWDSRAAGAVIGRRQALGHLRPLGPLRRLGQAAATNGTCWTRGRLTPCRSLLLGLRDCYCCTQRLADSEAQRPMAQRPNGSEARPPQVAASFPEHPPMETTREYATAGDAEKSFQNANCSAKARANKQLPSKYIPSLLNI
jgi:hypothetical protein